MASGPSEQLTPMLNRPGACSTEYQNASSVCPDRVRPLRSVIVMEIISGTCLPPAS